jgi:hypothetical protein
MYRGETQHIDRYGVVVDRKVTVMGQCYVGTVVYC